jgi:hypothetical protein
MYWDGGYESINEVSRRCFESWKYHNHDWDIRFLDNDNVTEYFDRKEVLSVLRREV